MRIQIGKPYTGGPFRTTCPGCGGIGREGSGGWSADGEGKGRALPHKTTFCCGVCQGRGSLLVEPASESVKSDPAYSSPAEESLERR